MAGGLLQESVSQVQQPKPMSQRQRAVSFCSSKQDAVPRTPFNSCSAHGSKIASYAPVIKALIDLNPMAFKSWALSMCNMDSLPDPCGAGPKLHCRLP